MHFENDGMRLRLNGTGCGGVLMTVSNHKGRSSRHGCWRREASADRPDRRSSYVSKDGFCADNVSGVYSSAQRLAESSCSRYGCRLFEEAPLFTGRIYSLETVREAAHSG